MADEAPTTEQQSITDANLANQPKGSEEFHQTVAEPTEADMNVDHLEIIREIALLLPNASPEGATTASQKILMHLDAFKNPDRFVERERALKEQEDREEEVRAKRRAAIKEPVPEKDKEASEAVAKKEPEYA